MSWEPLRRVARNTLPVISSQGIFQVSSLVDISLAALVGTSAMSALGYSQRLIYLPISLFGMSVAAAALPHMSREGSAARIRPRLVNGFFQILFFVLPTAVFLLLFGDLAVRVIYERRAFGEASTILVASVLGAYALGLVASSSLRLFSSGFHALQDTRTPMKLAAISVGAGIGAAIGLTLVVRARLQAPYEAYAAVAIAGGGALGAWLNLLLLWQALDRRLGGLLDGRALRSTLRLVLAAGAAGLAGVAGRAWLGPRLSGPGLLPAIALLLGVAACGAVPYILIARRPPIVAEGDANAGG